MASMFINTLSQVTKGHVWMPPVLQGFFQVYEQD